MTRYSSCMIVQCKTPESNYRLLNRRTSLPVSNNRLLFRQTPLPESNNRLPYRTRPGYYWLDTPEEYITGFSKKSLFIKYPRNIENFYILVLMLSLVFSQFGTINNPLIYNFLWYVLQFLCYCSLLGESSQIAASIFSSVLSVRSLTESSQFGTIAGSLTQKSS